MTTHTLQKFKWSQRARGLFFVFILCGVVSFLYGLKVDHQRAWAAYLTGYFFWLCLGLAGVFFTALHHITGAYWSTTVRRVAEAFIAYLPLAVVFFLILLFGAHDLFEWTHQHAVEADPLLSGKAAYLNLPFMVVRAMALFAVCLGLGGWMVRNSIKQDGSGDVALTKLNVKIAAPFLLLFAWLFTFHSIDLLMSLSPHWFSTIFGVYCWAGLFFSGLAMIVIWAGFLKNRGVLSGYVNQNHFFDLGKLMFAFTVFWAYSAFSQFMLIWYANLPEETFFYLDRLKNGWGCVSQALIIAKFAVPFLLLMGAYAKKNQAWLTVMAFWFLGAQYLDLYWLVYPTFFETPVFGWMEVGTFLGFAGFFFLSVGYFLSRVNAVAIKDPQLEQALHHHQA